MRGQVERVAQWWEGNVYPDAGEVIGWRETRLLHQGKETSYPPSVVRVRTVAGSAAPPAIAESNRDRAARRAKSRLRRYCVANRLRYMWVLTFAPDAEGLQEFDLRRAKRATAFWVKRALRAELGYRGAYAIGWERHRSGAWHVNVVIGERVEYEDVGRTWGHGNVWVSRFSSRQGESARDAARRAAAYVAKYVSKEFETVGEEGIHRYEVAQGFQLRVVRVFALSATGIIEEAGGQVVYRFDAPVSDSLRGPPIVWAAFR